MHLVLKHILYENSLKKVMKLLNQTNVYVFMRNKPIEFLSRNYCCLFVLVPTYNDAICAHVKEILDLLLIWVDLRIQNFG